MLYVYLAWFRTAHKLILARFPPPPANSTWTNFVHIYIDTIFSRMQTFCGGKKKDTWIMFFWTYSPLLTKSFLPHFPNVFMYLRKRLAWSHFGKLILGSQPQNSVWKVWIEYVQINKSYFFSPYSPYLTEREQAKHQRAAMYHQDKTNDEQKGTFILGQIVYESSCANNGGRDKGGWVRWALKWYLSSGDFHPLTITLLIVIQPRTLDQG